MSIPFLDLARVHGPLRGEMERGLTRVLDSGQFILGEEVRALEESLAGLCGVPHAVAVASGTDAIYLALMALGAGEGDEVVTTPFTFIATATSISRAGARPVFADIDPGTFNLDPAAAEAALTPRTKAVIPVDLYGRCASWEAFEALARRRSLGLVEDAAQSIGAAREERRAGSFGDAAAFSFYPTKNLGGLGDSGLVTTGDAAIAARVRLLRAHGDTGGYDHAEIGINSRMDAFQAALLRVKLAHLRDWNEERRRIASLYTDRLSRSSGAGRLTEGGHIETPAMAPAGEVPAWHQYVIRARDRDGLAARLRAAGIGCAIYYPVPLHLQSCYRHLGYAEGSFPEAERACREVLALPIYPGLRDEEVEEVCRTILAHVGAPRR